MGLVVQAAVREGRALVIAAQGPAAAGEDPLADPIGVGLAEAANGQHVLWPLHQPLRRPITGKLVREEGGRRGAGEPATAVDVAKIAGP